MKAEAWSDVRSWSRLRAGGRETMTADAGRRALIARRLDLESLDSLAAVIGYDAWLDGVRLHLKIAARAVRLCGVTLDSFTEIVQTDFAVTVVPEGSPNAPAPEAELTIALDAEDPPDVARGDGVDLAAYVVEALGLALDPFPRAPGAMFEFVDPRPETSAFHVLSILAGKSNSEP